MNLKSIIIGAIFGTLLLASGIYQWQTFIKVESPAKFGDTTIQPIYATNTNTGVLCTTSSGLLVATSSNPGFLRISNTSPFTIFLALGNPPAVLYQGLTLFASTSIEFNQTNFYAGQIYCISSGGNASTTISESK